MYVCSIFARVGRRTTTGETSAIRSTTHWAEHHRFRSTTKTQINALIHLLSPAGLCGCRRSAATDSGCGQIWTQTKYCSSRHARRCRAKKTDSAKRNRVFGLPLSLVVVLDLEDVGALGTIRKRSTSFPAPAYCCLGGVRDIFRVRDGAASM